MVSVILIVTAVLAAVSVWVWRRRRGQTSTAPLLQDGIPRETLALEAFTRGNTCLAEGKFAEATTLFHKARDLDPKRAHVADRLAEVERRQQAALATPTASSPA